MLGDPAFSAESVDQGQRDLHHHPARAQGVRRFDAAEPVVRRHVQAGESLGRDRRDRRPGGRAARDFGGEVGPRGDRLRHRRVPIGGNISSAELLAQRIGELDRRRRVDPQRAREIDLVALELTGREDQAAGGFRQLGLGARHVDRGAHTGLLLRNRQLDELRSKGRVGLARSDDGHAANRARVGNRDVLRARLHRRRALRHRRRDLTLGRADVLQIREVEQRLLELHPAVDDIERTDETGHPRE